LEKYLFLEKGGGFEGRSAEEGNEENQSGVYRSVSIKGRDTVRKGWGEMGASGKRKKNALKKKQEETFVIRVSGRPADPKKTSILPHPLKKRNLKFHKRWLKSEVSGETFFARTTVATVGELDSLSSEKGRDHHNQREAGGGDQEGSSGVNKQKLAGKGGPHHIRWGKVEIEGRKGHGTKDLGDFSCQGKSLWKSGTRFGCQQKKEKRGRMQGDWAYQKKVGSVPPKRGPCRESVASTKV